MGGVGFILLRDRESARARERGRPRERERESEREVWGKADDCLKCFGGYLSGLLAPVEIFGWAYSPGRGPASPGANSRNSQRWLGYRASIGWRGS
jgi:hypothetical protein